MEILLSSKYNVIIIILAIRFVYSTLVYLKISCSANKRILLAFLSFLFPVITGIICSVKYKRSPGSSVVILVSLVISLGLVLFTSVTYMFINQSPKFYEKNGTMHLLNTDVIYEDEQGNKYGFKFDKSGYDKLYVNNTDEYLNSDLCYINEQGYLIYDDDMSISAKNETSCIDDDGSLYYPVRFAAFNKDGTINYSFNSANFHYDRLGKAYTYKCVPYYDKNGDKYSYSFDSNTQKGTYTKVNTGAEYENERCFVDENGYFVFDENNSFTKQDAKNVQMYKDADGNIYYLASSIFWNENGELLDSLGKILE